MTDLSYFKELSRRISPRQIYSGVLVASFLISPTGDMLIAQALLESGQFFESGPTFVDGDRVVWGDTPNVVLSMDRLAADKGLAFSLLVTLLFVHLITRFSSRSDDALTRGQTVCIVAACLIFVGGRIWVQYQWVDTISRNVTLGLATACVALACGRSKRSVSAK